MLAGVRARAHFHAAVEFCSVFDGHARRFQIADYLAGVAEDHALAAAQVPLDLPLDENFGCFDIRANMSGLSDGQARFAQTNAAVDFAVNHQIGFAGQFAFNANAAREHRSVRPRWRRLRSRGRRRR